MDDELSIKILKDNGIILVAFGVASVRRVFAASHAWMYGSLVHLGARATQHSASSGMRAMSHYATTLYGAALTTLAYGPSQPRY